MTIAIRRKVTVKSGGRIEIRSLGLKPGTLAEVIVLVDQPEQGTVTSSAAELALLSKETQSLPTAKTISEEEISAEIEAYRLENQ